MAVSDRELPHLSNRTDCYALIDGYAGADYILWIPPFEGGRDGTHAREAIESGQYEEIATRPGVSLYKRKGAPGPLAPPAAKGAAKTGK